MATTVDEHIVKIVQQVTGYAAAHKALLAVEERIKAEEDALKGMEDALTSAKTKLAEMMEGAGKGSVNLAAIDKQRASSLDEIRRETLVVVFASLEKVLSKKVTEELDKKFITEVVKELEKYA